MIYFFHHYELPAIMQQAHIQQLFLRSQNNLNNNNNNNNVNNNNNANINEDIIGVTRDLGAGLPQQPPQQQATADGRIPNSDNNNNNRFFLPRIIPNQFRRNINLNNQPINFLNNLMRIFYNNLFYILVNNNNNNNNNNLRIFLNRHGHRLLNHRIVIAGLPRRAGAAVAETTGAATAPATAANTTAANNVNDEEVTSSNDSASVSDLTTTARNTTPPPSSTPIRTSHHIRPSYFDENNYTPDEIIGMEASDMVSPRVVTNVQLIDGESATVSSSTETAVTVPDARTSAEPADDNKFYKIIKIENRARPVNAGERNDDSNNCNITQADVAGVCPRVAVAGRDVVDKLHETTLRSRPDNSSDFGSHISPLNSDLQHNNSLLKPNINNFNYNSTSINRLESLDVQNSALSNVRDAVKGEPHLESQLSGQVHKFCDVDGGEEADGEDNDDEEEEDMNVVNDSVVAGTATGGDGGEH